MKNNSIDAGKADKKYLILIGVLSVVVPGVVALLLFLPSKLSIQSGWVFLLPHLNALLNATTSVLLMIGFYFIKKKEIGYHRLCMSVAFILGSLFLVSYIIYHASAPSTVFGDVNGNGVLDLDEKLLLGSTRAIYLVILLSHILLAIVVVPLVLLAFFFALTRRFEKHKKVVRYTWPTWLYVSITGVVVYLMISPYYQ